jgi:hypothetical protein
MKSIVPVLARFVQMNDERHRSTTGDDDQHGRTSAKAVKSLMLQHILKRILDLLCWTVPKLAGKAGSLKDDEERRRNKERLLSKDG